MAALRGRVAELEAALQARAQPGSGPAATATAVVPAQTQEQQQQQQQLQVVAVAAQQKQQEQRVSAAETALVVSKEHAVGLAKEVALLKVCPR